MAVALALLERYLLIVLALISNVVLARLLTPEQIGIYSVSLAVIGIAQVLRDFGIASFIIQERDLTKAHVETALGISLILGISLFSVVMLATPFIAAFYGEPRMMSTLRIAACSFLVMPICSVSLALLRRQMKFKLILWVSVCATLLGLLVTIPLAFAGVGADSMAYGAFATNLATAIGAWLLNDKYRLIRPAFGLWRRVIAFGMPNAAANLATTVSIDITEAVIGKAMGFSHVALLSRAQSLMQMIHRDALGAIRNVALPAFAAAHRAGADIEGQHIYSTTLLTAVVWPIYGFTSIFALDLIRILFGRQWDFSASLVPWFCGAGAVAATCTLIPQLLLAKGRVDLATRLDLIVQPARAVILVIAVLLTRSLEVVAILTFMIFVASVPLHYLLKQRCEPTRVAETLRCLSKSAAVTLLVAMPLMAFSLAVAKEDGSVGLRMILVATTGGAALWLLGLRILRHPLWTEPAFQRIFVLAAPGAKS